MGLNLELTKKNRLPWGRFDLAILAPVQGFPVKGVQGFPRNGFKKKSLLDESVYTAEDHEAFIWDPVLNLKD